MKLQVALIQSEAKHPAKASVLLKAEHGDELSFEGGLLMAKLKGTVVCWPAARVLYMEPEAKPAKKAEPK